MHEQRLIDAFTNKSARVGVVGLGYVGLPMVRTLHDAGFAVVGFDIDANKIESLKRGEAYLKHLGDDFVRELAASPRFTPTSTENDLNGCDVLVLCVPTPLGRHHEPDLTYVEESTKLAARASKPGTLIVLTSTSYPGTTREVCGPILAQTGMKIGVDLFLAFSPEREDPGREGVSTRTIPRLVGGVDDASTRLGMAFFRACVDQVIQVESAEVAEAAKLLENIYRSVNIALVNELKPVLGSMGIDIWSVIRAASTKPFGFQPFYPGPGLGGHCIPIDPFYLTWRAREFGHSTRFIELAGEINSRMPAHVVEATARALSDSGVAMKGAKVLVLGLAYKPDVDDVRETPAAEIIRLLIDRGAAVQYHDPHVAEFPRMRKYGFDLRSVTLTEAELARADAVLIVTDHAAVDYRLVGRAARLVVDTRNAMAKVEGPIRAKVVKA
jgi:UDP-N-acetyl-D-glucosamine dehydrogenase